MPLTAEEWGRLNARARETMDKTTRGKRKSTGLVRRKEPSRCCEAVAVDYTLMLDCPVVRGGSPEDYAILTKTLGVSGAGGLERLHALMDVGALPSNIRRMQMEALFRQVGRVSSVHFFF